jgi:hypothetical protein
MHRFILGVTDPAVAIDHKDHDGLKRNKHIQRVLVEAAKLAPRRNPDLALVYENARQKGNANCATLAVARKLVAYLMAVDREQRDFELVRGLAGIAA